MCEKSAGPKSLATPLASAVIRYFESFFGQRGSPGHVGIPALRTLMFWRPDFVAADAQLRTPVTALQFNQTPSPPILADANPSIAYLEDLTFGANIVEQIRQPCTKHGPQVIIVCNGVLFGSVTVSGDRAGRAMLLELQPSISTISYHPSNSVQCPVPCSVITWHRQLAHRTMPVPADQTNCISSRPPEGCRLFDIISESAESVRIIL